MTSLRVGSLRVVVMAVATVLLGLISQPAAQATVIFTDNAIVGGNTVTGSAAFTISGTTLTLTLTNTSPGNGLEAPTNTLTGLSFLINGLTPALTPVSAISPNAIVNPANCDANPCGGTNVNVGGEWGYQSSFGGKEAVGSAGYITSGLSGNLGNFNGLNLQNPVSLDGVEFGILSAAHGALNGGLSTQALVDDRVVLTLTVPVGTTEAQIGSVSFLYGTAPDATIPATPPSIPWPGTLVLLGMGLAGLGLTRHRKSV